MSVNVYGYVIMCRTGYMDCNIDVDKFSIYILSLTLSIAILNSIGRCTYGLYISGLLRASSREPSQARSIYSSPSGIR